MKLIGIGDNVVDRYADLKKRFPGGNALNVAVLCKRFGIDTGYIGCLGTDMAGIHILNTLKEEGVDVSRIKILEGTNAYCNVALVNNDRTFISSDKGVSQNITLDSEDIEYIKTYDLIHTSIYSGIESLLPELKKTKVKISLDYSNDFSQDYIKRTIPYVDYAFFSGSEMPESNIREFQEYISSLGPELVLVTKGDKGAFLYYQGKYYEQSIVETEVVDTLGAGDGFISRLLVGVLEKEKIEDLLLNSARAAARVCGYYGALGHGIDF